MSVDLRSRHFAFRGRSVEPPRHFAPVGSPQPRPPAGVFVPSAPINSVPKSTMCYNGAFKKRKGIKGIPDCCSFKLIA